jgi:hypothetical protein
VVHERRWGARICGRRELGDFVLRSTHRTLPLMWAHSNVANVRLAAGKLGRAAGGLQAHAPAAQRRVRPLFWVLGGVLACDMRP